MYRLRRAEQHAELARQRAAAAVVLQGDRACLDPEQRGSLGVEHLLHLLQLDEVVARADRPEPDTGELLDEPRELAANALAAAEGLDGEAPSLFDSVEHAWVELQPLARRHRSLGRVADDFVLAEDTAVGRRVRQRREHAPVEFGARGRVTAARGPGRRASSRSSASSTSASTGSCHGSRRRCSRASPCRASGGSPGVRPRTERRDSWRRRRPAGSRARRRRRGHSRSRRRVPSASCPDHGRRRPTSLRSRRDLRCLEGLRKIAAAVLSERQHEPRQACGERRPRRR